MAQNPNILDQLAPRTVLDDLAPVAAAQPRPAPNPPIQRSFMPGPSEFINRMMKQTVSPIEPVRRAMHGLGDVIAGSETTDYPPEDIRVPTTFGGAAKAVGQAGYDMTIGGLLNAFEGAKMLPEVAGTFMREPVATTRGFFGGATEALGNLSPLDLAVGGRGGARMGKKGLASLKNRRIEGAKGPLRSRPGPADQPPPVSKADLDASAAKLDDVPAMLDNTAAIDLAEGISKEWEMNLKQPRVRSRPQLVRGGDRADVYALKDNVGEIGERINPEKTIRPPQRGVVGKPRLMPPSLEEIARDALQRARTEGANAGDANFLPPDYDPPMPGIRSRTGGNTTFSPRERDAFAQPHDPGPAIPDPVGGVGAAADSGRRGIGASRTAGTIERQAAKEQARQAKVRAAKETADIDKVHQKELAKLVAQSEPLPKNPDKVAKVPSGAARANTPQTRPITERAAELAPKIHTPAPVAEIPKADQLRATVDSLGAAGERGQVVPPHPSEIPTISNILDSIEYPSISRPGAAKVSVMPQAPPQMEGGLPKMKTPDGVQGETFIEFVARTMDGMTPDRFNRLPGDIRNGAAALFKESQESISKPKASVSPLKPLPKIAKPGTKAKTVKAVPVETAIDRIMAPPKAPPTLNEWLHKKYGITERQFNKLPQAERTPLFQEYEAAKAKSQAAAPVRVEPPPGKTSAGLAHEAASTEAHVADMMEDARGRLMDPGRIGKLYRGGAESKVPGGTFYSPSKKVAAEYAKLEGKGGGKVVEVDPETLGLKKVLHLDIEDAADLEILDKALERSGKSTTIDEGDIDISVEEAMPEFKRAGYDAVVIDNKPSRIGAEHLGGPREVVILKEPEPATLPAWRKHPAEDTAFAEATSAMFPDKPPQIDPETWARTHAVAYELGKQWAEDMAPDPRLLASARHVLGTSKLFELTKIPKHVIRQLSGYNHRQPLRQVLAEADSRFKHLIDDPNGFMRIEALAAAGGAAAGGALAATIEGENAEDWFARTVSGMLIGGASGFGLAKGARAFGNRKPKGAKYSRAAQVQYYGRMLEELDTANLLAGPAVIKAGLGAFGGTMASLWEQLQKGNSRGVKKALRFMYREGPALFIKKLLGPAENLGPVGIYSAEIARKAGIKIDTKSKLGKVTKGVSTTVLRPFIALDAVANETMRRAGVSPAEGARQTVIGEPTTWQGQALMKVLNSHFILRFFAKFPRVRIGGLERGIEYTPGLNRLINTRHKPSDSIGSFKLTEQEKLSSRDLRSRAQFGGASMVLASIYGYYRDPGLSETALASSIAGPAYMPAAAAMTFGKAIRRGVDKNLPASTTAYNSVLDAATSVAQSAPQVDESAFRMLPQRFVVGAPLRRALGLDK